ncbi:MAG TPA: hypothetical protein VGJ26_14585 [Pirellulales bacterium]
MNLILHLTPETEARLKKQATLTGRSPEELALEALQERLASDVLPQESLSASSRIAQFREWLSEHPESSVARLDDSRESIYDGRGE